MNDFRKRSFYQLDSSITSPCFTQLTRTATAQGYMTLWRVELLEDNWGNCLKVTSRAVKVNQLLTDWENKTTYYGIPLYVESRDFEI